MTRKVLPIDGASISAHFGKPELGYVVLPILGPSVDPGWPAPLVRAARRYKGVKFVHRGRLPHKLDCVGLVWRAFRDAGVELPCPSDYGREPDLPRFMATIVEGLGPDIGRSQLQPGDVVTLRTANHPHHLAIVGDYPGGLSLIHASGEHGRVVEHRLSPEYLARIVTAHRRAV